MGVTEIHDFLQRQRYGVISSVSSSGQPQSALVGIAVTPQFEIIFDTLKTTRKYLNLTARPGCSFVVGWDNEQTLQLDGTALEPRDSELRRYQETYLLTWPECRSHLSWPGITHLVVRPNWLRFSDYNQSPPRIVELNFPADAFL